MYRDFCWYPKRSFNRSEPHWIDTVFWRLKEQFGKGVKSQGKNWIWSNKHGIPAGQNMEFKQQKGGTKWNQYEMIVGWLWLCKAACGEQDINSTPQSSAGVAAFFYGYVRGYTKVVPATLYALIKEAVWLHHTLRILTNLSRAINYTQVYHKFKKTYGWYKPSKICMVYFCFAGVVLLCPSLLSFLCEFI